MWGTWWEWGDPRLTSELILLFLYFGYMALRSAIDDTAKADRASAVLAMVGLVNIPIIHYSVEWWSSLHQGPTLVREGGPAISGSMLYPLLAMITGFTLLFAALLLARVRSEVLVREGRARWVRNLMYPRGETA
jgi:heme exporter protein C